MASDNKTPDFIPDHEWVADSAIDPQGAEVQYLSEGGPAFISDADAANIPGFGVPQAASMPAGTPQTAGMSQTPDFIPDHEWAAMEAQQGQYGSGMEQLKAGAEGFGQGLLGPLSTLAETKLLNIDPADIQARAEANPGTHLAGEAAGLVAPALLTGGAAPLAKLTQMGLIEGATKALGLEAGATLASKVGIGAAKAAVENMMLTGGDEVSKMILHDPNQTAQTAIAHIGLSGAVGSLIGGTAGGISHLWNANAERGAGKFINDFKARINEHTENPDPVASVTTELSDYYKGIQGVADEVYGPTGLKAQDISKAVPELNGNILNQTQEVGQKLSSTIDKMAADPYTYPPRLTKMLQADVNNFASKVSKEGITSAEVFDATQELKQTLQGYAKFEKRVAPFQEEHGFVKIAKNLHHDLRDKLEDEAIWGAAGKRQAAINKAFGEYLPSLKDFEKKFTTVIGDEKVIDPAKVQTYYNQLEKASGKTKKEILGNFLDDSDKYKKVLDTTHANLGLESPAVDSTLNVTRRTLGEKTLGEKAADYMIEKGLAKGAGAGLGAGMGASVAHVAGLHGGIGALIGAHTVGPFLSSILPGIARAIARSGPEVTAKGLKASTELGVSAYKGEMLLDKTIKNLFKAGRELLPIAGEDHPGVAYAASMDRKREQLKRSVAAFNANPGLLLNNVDSHLNHFTPGVADSLSQTSGQALTYLAGLRPVTDPGAPLDSKKKPSQDFTAEYNRALDIAQNPMIVLKKMEHGTFTSRDMNHLSNMYPDLMKKMQMKLQNQMVTTIQKGGKGAIPYKTRLGLSLFLGQPLDSTMKPHNIQSTQIKTGAAAQQQFQQSQGVKSSPALQKMADMYRTPTQARLNHQQTK